MLMTGPIDLKIIFLDVDGVLNNAATWQRRRPEGAFNHINQTEPELIDRLAQIVHRTNAKIVLSSTWRMDIQAIADLSDYFAKIHSMSILDKTPWLPETRGDQIDKWYRKYDDIISHYVIIDDDSDMLPEQLPYFVKTENSVGLTDQHVEKVVTILTGPELPQLAVAKERVRSQLKALYGSV